MTIMRRYQIDKISRHENGSDLTFEGFPGFVLGMAFNTPYGPVNENLLKGLKEGSHVWFESLGGEPNASFLPFHFKKIYVQNGEKMELLHQFV